MRQYTRGITLVEALLALLILSLGLLGMARVHVGMRVNADLARQRTEALRIARAEMDALRTFTAIASTSGARAFADISETAERTEAAGASSYAVVRRVAPIVDSLAVAVTVNVRWRDREGAEQLATLSSIVARSEPALEAVAFTVPSSLAASPLRH